MWDKPQVLNAIANVLFAAALLLALYAAVMVTARLPIFPLREVRVLSAPRFTERPEIEAAVAAGLRGNFFTLELARVRGAFETLPWVRRAELRRQWPHRLEVRLEEHVPLARWGAQALVNSHGEVFAARYEGHLPLFEGPAGSAKEMAIQFAYFRATLGSIGHRPVQVSVSARRAWALRLENGLTVELGRTDLENRLARFVQSYAQVARLLGGRMHHVDLRYSNGFAVRVPGPQGAEPRDKRR
jgi:cell division protein FtsQ